MLNLDLDAMRTADLSTLQRIGPEALADKARAAVDAYDWPAAAEWFGYAADAALGDGRSRRYREAAESCAGFAAEDAAAGV